MSKRKRTHYPSAACSTCGRLIPVNVTTRHARTHDIDARSRSLVPLDEQREIVALYARVGGSLRSVSAQTFWSPGTVRQVLVANGVHLRARGGTRRRHITSEEELRRCELYGQGWSIREIAADVGVSYRAVYNTLKRANVKMRARGQRSQRVAA